tara:strand:+ start:156 stop:1076 length:921 start_codon:yes stop_codon:yes gene_type:complete
MAFSISFTDEQSWYEENYEVEDAGEIETEDLEECEYKNMRSTFDLFEKLKKENETLQEDNKELKVKLSNTMMDTGRLAETIWEKDEEIKKLKERVEFYAEHNKKLNSDMDESEKHDWKKKYHHLNTRFTALEIIEKKLKEEHKKFDEIWKTEGITEQDIIDMKRQISNQCDLIKKLKKTNRMQTDSIMRTLKADWKNQYYYLEQEALKENADLKEKMKGMKPASTNTNKEWDVVFKATSKEIAGLKEENKTLNKMIDNLPNDMEDKWWCEKKGGWRWDDDGFEEEEESSEEESSEEEDEDEEEEDE